MGKHPWKFLTIKMIGRDSPFDRFGGDGNVFGLKALWALMFESDLPILTLRKLFQSFIPTARNSHREN
jgi:hypothetical protein